MIDFVLQNSSIPAFRINHTRFSSFIHTLDVYGKGTRYQRHKSGETEAPFEKRNFSSVGNRQLRVDNDMERDRGSFPCRKLLGRDLPVVFQAIFDDRQLQREADLRCRLTPRLGHPASFHA